MQRRCHSAARSRPTIQESCIVAVTKSQGPHSRLPDPSLPAPQELLNTKWTKKKWAGPLQYEDPSGKLMMLPTDMALVWDKKFKK